MEMNIHVLLQTYAIDDTQSYKSHNSAYLEFQINGKCKNMVAVPGELGVEEMEGTASCGAFSF